MRRRFSNWVALGVLASIAVLGTTAGAAPKAGKKKKPPPVETQPDFDRQAALDAILGITDGGLVKCKATNAAQGDGHVTIKFSPGGAVQSAVVDRGPWIGTPVAKCMQREFKKAKVPSFRGGVVTVGKSFHFE
jgi:hypothetical protein